MTIQKTLTKNQKKTLVDCLYRTMKNNPKYSYRFKRDYMWNVLYSTIVDGVTPTDTVNRLRSILSETQIDNLLVKTYNDYVKEKGVAP